VIFRNLPTVFGLIVMAVCISTGQTPSAGESGIEGVITIGPVHPGPTRVDGVGSTPLANATFAVEKNNGEVTSFITDEKGRFRVSLPPGHYKISLKGRKSSIGSFGPFEAEVAPGKMTNVQWECDTGIR
jgi:Prealbumin-like fold domain